MRTRSARRLQTISLAMLAWFALSWLAGWHWLLAGVLWTFAMLNVTVIWMLHGRSKVLESAMRFPLIRHYVALVCTYSKEQLPAHPRDSNSGLLLRSKEEFSRAAERVQEHVRGLDPIVHRIFFRIHESRMLRKLQLQDARRGPLASFVVSGPHGVGKRFLAHALAKELYRGGAIATFRCKHLNVSHLLGGKDSPGKLESIRRNPHQLLLFDQVEQASPEVTSLLNALLTHGKLRISESDREVSFEHATVLLVVSSEAGEAGDLRCQQQTIEQLTRTTSVDTRLLQAATEVFAVDAPSERVKSEVVALLMQQECRAHRVELTRVAPEIIATQVCQLQEPAGFSDAAQQIKKLLRKPLVAAAEGDHSRLSLRIHH